MELGSEWDPAQYERFEAERARPFHDLVALVEPASGIRVVDLGCGTGQLTRALHERLGASATVGVDTSPTMLAKAAAHADGNLSFEQRDMLDFAATTAPGAFDLVFSNAALHWVTDHPGVWARLARLVAPGGQLAIQVPANHDQPPARVADEVAHEEPHRTRLGGFVRHHSVLPPEAYARLLHDLGFVTQRVQLAVYAHVLPSRDAVIEWVKGTTLTPYARRLEPPGRYDAYLDAYRARLFEHLPDARPFFYPFKRILMWARRAAG